MDEKFLWSGVFQYLSEAEDTRGLLFDYGLLIGRKELPFDEGLMGSKARLHDVMKRVGGRQRHGGNSTLMDW